MIKKLHEQGKNTFNLTFAMLILKIDLLLHIIVNFRQENLRHEQGSSRFAKIEESFSNTTGNVELIHECFPKSWAREKHE